MTITLAIDAMGGDRGISITIPAALRFLKNNPTVKIILVGQEALIKKKLGNRLSHLASSIEIVNATEVIAMDEAPQVAMRMRDSSMRVAINQVHNKKADAIISAGNTGALMAISRYVLRTMQGIDRPAIAKIMPNMTGTQVCMLDLGANVDATSEQLVQFAIIGSQMMQAVYKKPNPRIGLLNIGSEEIKGHEFIKKAAEMLRASDLNFYGNVEGNDISRGTVDVIVCDGFTGNVALKTMEGTAKMIGAMLKQELSKSWVTKILGIIAYPILRNLKSRLDSRKYNGAMLVGLTAPVIKSHGGADSIAFYFALEQAYHEVKSGVIVTLEEFLKNHPIASQKEF